MPRTRSARILLRQAFLQQHGLDLGRSWSIARACFCLRLLAVLDVGFVFKRAVNVSERRGCDVVDVDVSEAFVIVRVLLCVVFGNVRAIVHARYRRQAGVLVAFL